MIRICAIALAALALAACQSVTSRHVDYGAGGVITGIQYSAPKAVMRVELYAKGLANGRAELYLAISRPFLVGDPEATFALTASTSMLADQKYVVVVNPQTRLLSYINSQSTGQAGEILRNIAQSLGAIGSVNRTPSITGDESDAVPQGEERLLFSTVIDPFLGKNCEFGETCTLTELNDSLRKRAIAFFECAPPTAADAEPVPTPNRATCEKLRDANYFSVSINPLFAFEALRPLAEPKDCHSSICYRAPAPYTLSVKIGNVSDHSELVMMPNKSPILAMDLEAGIFADAKTRVDLVHGMPATIAVERKSELVAITAIPLQVIASLFDGVSKVFQLRINYGTQTGNLLASEQKRLAAIDTYNKFLRERDAAAAALARAQKAEAAAPPAQKTHMIAETARAAETLEQSEKTLEEAVAELGEIGVSPPLDASGAQAEIADGGGGVGGAASDESSSLALQIDPSDDTTGAGVWKLDQAPITTIERGSDDRLFNVNIATGAKTTVEPVKPGEATDAKPGGNR